MKSLSSILSNTLLENADDLSKLSDEQREQLLACDKSYHEFMTTCELIQNDFSHVTNKNALIDELCDAYDKHDDKYVPKLKTRKLKSRYDIADKRVYDKLQRDAESLMEKFRNIDCYVSKFYIEQLKNSCDILKFLRHYIEDDTFVSKHVWHPSKRVYEYACELLKKYPYESVKKLGERDEDFKHNVPAQTSRKRLQREIDKRDMDWTVKLDANMIPRMSVKTWHEFDISDHKLFSEVDLQSLCVHEVEVHTARKFNALKSGLYLMLHGLYHASVLDEGCAIYNTIHKTKKVKPNIRFWIAIKIYILYHLHKKPVMEIMRDLVELTHQKRIVALAIIRALRVASNGYEYSYNCDADYLTGYMIVKQLSQRERDELIKYNIGENAMFELTQIKRFFELNKFDELKNE